MLYGANDSFTLIRTSLFSAKFSKVLVCESPEAGGLQDAKARMPIETNLIDSEFIFSPPWVKTYRRIEKIK